MGGLRAAVQESGQAGLRPGPIICKLWGLGQTI